MARQQGAYQRVIRRWSSTFMALALSSQLVVSAGADPAPRDQESAAKSLEAILQQAAEDGFIVGKSEKPANTSKPAAVKAPSPDNTTSSKAQTMARPSSGNCAVAQAADVTAFTDIAVLADTTEARAKLRQSDWADEDMKSLIMNYIALGLGTEARALSERVDAPLLASLGRLLADEAEAQDRALIQSYKSCGGSFSVWDFAAHIASPDRLDIPRAIEPVIFERLSKFPPSLREQLELQFAIYAAETGDIFNAERIMRELFPETKYGELPARKDDDVLYLHALILQQKGDANFVEILTHLATFDGLYKTKAVQALARDSVVTGRALPDTFESDLAAIDYQYGDAVEGKAASLELVKFRSDRHQFSDAINTAKLKFSDTDPQWQESVELIATEISLQLNGDELSPRLYALDGYFHDPDFFDTYSKLQELVFNIHSTAIDLGFPELAEKLTTQLKSLEAADSSVDIQTHLLIAQAALALKNARFEDAVKSLETVKSYAPAETLRQQASLASGDRALVQSVFSETKASEARDREYLEFVLQKGRWAEAKVLTANLSTTQDATVDALPFSLNAATLNYLANPTSPKVNTKLPDSANELDGLLSRFKTNAQLAKGLLNYAPSES